MLAKLLGGRIAAGFAPVMKSRFQPDKDTGSRLAPTSIDPEGFDVSEQQFAASLEEKSAAPRTQFVLENAELPARPADPHDEDHRIRDEAGLPSAQNDKAPSNSVEQTSPPDAWRSEVAARVNHYRGRRPRVPRYPSLLLKFESPEPASPEQHLTTDPTPVAASRGQLAVTLDLDVEAPAQTTQPAVDIPAMPESNAKILEFPRSSFMPPTFVEELAEPVFEQPRIMEVPEVLPPPPALGGILIESSERDYDERRPGFELPLKSAPLSRRILGGLTDALIVLASFTAFGYIFFRMTSIIPPLNQLVSVCAVLFALFWSAYQYVLLVFAGSTPGLKLAGLQLSRFDGSAVPRQLRRWRVLASVLSGLSLALGYAWCFLDEDELCWHDRITHTYMAPKTEEHGPASTDE